MTDADLEPPPDDLRELFARERDISEVDRAAIRDRLEATLAAPATPTKSLASGKTIAIGLATLAAAAGVWWLVTRGAEPASPPPAPAAPVEVVAPAQPPVEQRVEPAPDEPVPAPDAPPRQVSQSELLARAWQALASQPARTLELVTLDERLHPRGALVEERDALRVRALAALGRFREARTHATRFVERFPSSVHRKSVEAAVEPPR
jgi:hypothetical protein